MIYPVWQQFFILSAAMAGGFVIAAFFDAAEAIRLLLHLPKKRPLYILFWLLCAVSFFALWQQLFNGAFRLIYFWWIAAGFALYYFCLANPLKNAARRKSKNTSPIIRAVRIFSRGDEHIYAAFCACAKGMRSGLRYLQKHMARFKSLIFQNKSKNDEKI